MLTYSIIQAREIRKFHVVVMLASHAGVFRRTRFSSLPRRDEKRPPLKTPAWEATVVQERLRNVQKSVMHVQSCFFASLNLLFFRCSPSPLQKLPIAVIQTFATMVTWHHTSPLYWSDWFRSVLLTELKPRTSDVWAKIWYRIITKRTSFFLALIIQIKYRKIRK